ncbi:UDP-N-acetylglucosamine 2-epimerase (hydrolysing) [Flavobacterium fontis]|uniref:UDP-N-acetylglucosamine 2-epimerase (Hydrolysing) n=1 Tax=Flavobacterium fontis TaxID=1124188 RepID=A0A1M5CMQ9_9FLAO|nr:UDP-N-acetylglucosamine 2-epimerase [Flavobacterium fontis]SHF55991.1 UDP-N-acetylglucosamine 2-epimerase (hydrolysing) [Flavobacterium fontis]
MKKIVFLTGTRADFGKIKSLIQILEEHPDFEPYVFVTGMHLQQTYGYTLIEIQRCQFSQVHTFENHTHETTMDLTLAKTIEGFSAYVKTIQPDMIVVHGDRVETLAGAIVGSLNNILVAHIEGGELSGTVDELIRHSVSKLSHVHFVSHEEAANRLIQMGEMEPSIVTIGSPDVDIMFSDQLPSLDTAKTYYEIPFDAYGILMFHPVTTEAAAMQGYAQQLVQALLDDTHNYVVIYPNNDLGSQKILDAYAAFQGHSRFRVFPSLRFEYFLTLLKNAQFIIGNSSAGIREAPYYGVPIVNIGTRQQNRALHADIINTDYSFEAIREALKGIDAHAVQPSASDFGAGNSAALFLAALQRPGLWDINHQKQFKDR